MSPLPDEEPVLAFLLTLLRTAHECAGMSKAGERKRRTCDALTPQLAQMWLLSCARLANFYPGC